MESFKGKIHSVMFGAKGEKYITFELKGNVQKLAAMFENLDIEITVKKYFPKRSNDANAYAWTLMDKLAASYGVDKTAIYKQAIKEIGGNTEIVCVQDAAVDKLCKGWGHNGIGWITDTMPSRLDGCTNVVLYYGSSTYDTAQMARLIDSVVQECELRGIETLPPGKLASMIETWGTK